MKKIFNFILHSIYILILIILALFLFWEGYAKRHMENYIDEEYGIYLIRSYKDLQLLKQYDLPLKNDKNADNTIRD
jgi:hypothetical protein